MADRIRPLIGGKTHRMVQYRNRAEELRTIADDMLVESERETLLSIANTYDKLANDISVMIEVWPT